jgi:hypothetical protein
MLVWMSVHGGVRVCQYRIYAVYIYGIFGREITKLTVIYGVYIRFWPTLGRVDT